MPTIQISTPAVEPVTLQFVKDHTIIEEADDDALILSYIEAARRSVEQKLVRSLITRQLRHIRTGLPSVIELERPPLISVEEIKYIDGAGVWQTLPPALYNVHSDDTPGRVVCAYGSTFPIPRSEHNNVEIDYTAGYGAAPEDIPITIRQAIAMMVAHWYQNREPLAERAMLPVPMTIDHLLNPDRVYIL